MKRTLIIYLCSLLTIAVYAEPLNDKEDIKQVITDLVKGIDEQDGDRILRTFRENATLQATNQGKIIAVPYDQFAKMHASKRFGGRQREMTIESIDITDGIIANAKVVAQDDVVHYVYYLNLSKTDGKWLIQGFMQHSKKK